MRARLVWGERTYAICENLLSHLTDEMAAFWEQNCIMVVPPPNYAFSLNPFEPQLGPLRCLVTNESDQPGHDALASAIVNYLD